MDSHSADCAQLGKPFVLEEFGKNVTVPVTAAGIAAERDPAFQTVYTKLLASLASNGTFQGALRSSGRLLSRNKCYAKSQTLYSWHACRRAVLEAGAAAAGGF